MNIFKHWSNTKQKHTPCNASVTSWPHLFVLTFGTAVKQHFHSSSETLKSEQWSFANGTNPRSRCTQRYAKCPPPSTMALQERYDWETWRPKAVTQLGRMKGAVTKLWRNILLNPWPPSSMVRMTAKSQRTTELWQCAIIRQHWANLLKSIWRSGKMPDSMQICFKTIFGRPEYLKYFSNGSVSNTEPNLPESSKRLYCSL